MPSATRAHSSFMAKARNRISTAIGSDHRGRKRRPKRGLVNPCNASSKTLEITMSSINYSDKIPNNVNLSEDRTLQRALEHWQPNYRKWWNEMGPEGSQEFDVYLRTATSVDP